MINDLFSMAGKVCVVTGGSSGLGSYMAQGFLEAGASRVYITARSADRLHAKARELSAVAAGECIGLPGDLESLNGVHALSEDIHDREDHINVLVNNAGVGTGGPFDDITEGQWDEAMDLNLKSPFFLTQALHDLLKAKAIGRRGMKNVEGYELRERQSPYNRVFDPEKCSLRLKNDHLWQVS